MAEVTTVFFERGKYLGQMLTEDFTHVSSVYVCPTCGHAWGKRCVIADGEYIDYIAEVRPCRYCGNSRLISPFDPIDKLPEAVMAREICYGLQEWLR